MYLNNLVSFHMGKHLQNQFEEKKRFLKPVKDVCVYVYGQHRNTGVWFCFSLVKSLSGSGMRIIPVSQNKLESIPSHLFSERISEELSFPL